MAFIVNKVYCYENIKTLMPNQFSLTVDNGKILTEDSDNRVWKGGS